MIAVQDVIVKTIGFTASEKSVLTKQHLQNLGSNVLCTSKDFSRAKIDQQLYLDPKLTPNPPQNNFQYARLKKSQGTLSLLRYLYPTNPTPQIQREHKKAEAAGTRAPVKANGLPVKAPKPTSIVRPSSPRNRRVLPEINRQQANRRVDSARIAVRRS
jgi:hypothetical protein